MKAGADLSALAGRAAPDALRVLEVHPTAPVHVVQDGASELRVLPTRLADTLPASATVRTLDAIEAARTAVHGTPGPPIVAGDP